MGKASTVTSAVTLTVTRVTKVLTLIGLCSAAQISAVSSINAAEPDGPDVLISLEDALEHHIIAKIKTSLTGKTEYDKKIREDLTEFYQQRDRKPFWFKNDRLTDLAKASILEIKNGTEYGLKVSDLEFPSAELINGTATQRAEAELMISRAIITYAKRAKGGQLIPQNVSRSLDNSPEYLAPMQILKTISTESDVKIAFKSFQPKHQQFWALKEQLDLIRSATGATKPLVKIPDGSSIQPFDKNEQVALLRERLNVSVPIKNGAPIYPEDIYDSALVAAVKNFQAANGIRSTGVVNNSTRNKLNKGKPNPEKQILANMERWRWMPTEFGKTHVRVNIPEYIVRVTMNNKIVHSERVVTGKTSQKTPSFSDTMETVVFNPYWNVPQSIIWNEMGGVAPSGYEHRVVNGRTYIRQPPGPRNALGRVKFLFPNKHSVYLHDTPSKSLFNRSTRAFSHGCIRVRDPLKLAEVLLTVNKIDRKSINSRVASGRNQYVALDYKIPVHITYFTMWVNEDGKTSYFNDIYGHDKRVIAALEGRPMGLEPKQRIKPKPKPVYVKKPQPNFMNFFFN